MPSPVGATAITVIDDAHIAILSSSKTLTEISIISSINGQILTHFTVPKNARRIASTSENGPILVAVNGGDFPKKSGSIDAYSLSGIRLYSRSLDSQALDVTSDSGSTTYILAKDKLNRKLIVPFFASQNRFGIAFPTDPNITSISSCMLNGKTYIATASDGDNPIALIDASSHKVESSTSPGVSASCNKEASSVYAIQRDSSPQALDVFSMPHMMQTEMFDSPQSPIALTSYKRNLFVLHGPKNQEAISIFSLEEIARATQSDGS